MQESILDDPYIAELRERRRQIDEVKVQREKDGTKVKKMNIDKAQKELEYLIQDRHLINRRNDHIFQEIAEVKRKTFQNVGTVNAAHEHLLKSKQEIYNHLLKYRPKEIRASIFFQLTNTPETNYQTMIQQIEAKGAQMNDKENELYDLQKENEKLKQELEFQHGQQAYVNEYQMSPFLNQDLLFQNQGQNKQTTQLSQGSVEQKLIDQYAAGSSVDYQQEGMNVDIDLDRKIKQTEPIEFLNQNYKYEEKQKQQQRMNQSAQSKPKYQKQSDFEMIEDDF